MTIPPRIRSPRYNKLKKHTLETFERRAGWISPPEWAVLVGFYPVRAAYSYLLRLHRFGLLERQESPRGVLYSLSEKGRQRIAWLGQRDRSRDRD
jgi:DNA-binding transcriptional regulator PaaX